MALPEKIKSCCETLQGPQVGPFSDCQRGSTIVSFLMALAIVTVVAGYSLTSILNIREIQDRAESGTVYNEFEPIIRSNVGNMVFHLQKNLVNKNSCNKARKEFKLLSGMLNSGVKMVSKINSSAIPKKLAAKPNATPHKPYTEAIKRCQKQSLDGSSSLKGKSSFYFCGLLSSPQRSAGLSYLGKKEKLLSFAEFRVTFWDFARGVPLKCNEMESRVGRGGIVQYTVYFIKDKPINPGKKDVALGLRRHSGRFYVPKFPAPAKKS